MAEFTVDLPVGITLGSVCHKKAIMRDATVQDILEATEESEKLVMAPVGVDDAGNMQREPQLVVSPTACGVNTLRRQIVSIGPLQGPFDSAMLNKLDPDDFHALQHHLQLREQAALQAVAQRGRGDGTGSDNNAAGE